jgi:hypothetical protein
LGDRRRRQQAESRSDDAQSQLVHLRRRQSTGWT